MVLHGILWFITYYPGAFALIDTLYNFVVSCFLLFNSFCHSFIVNVQFVFVYWVKSNKESLEEKQDRVGVASCVKCPL